MNAPWLFAGTLLFLYLLTRMELMIFILTTEAYKYRRLHECFSLSKYWKDYDVFFRQSTHQIGSLSDYLRTD